MNRPDVSGMNVLQGFTKTIGSPVQAGFEEAGRGITDMMGLGGPEREEAARRGGEFANNVAPLVAPFIAELAMPRAAAATRAEPTLADTEGAAPQATPEQARPSNLPTGEQIRQASPGTSIVDTPRGPIRLHSEDIIVDTDEGPIQKNAPATPDRQMAGNETVSNANDPVAMTKEVAAKAGVPEPNVTVGQVPVSRSYTGPDGTPNIDLADGTVDEAVHEVTHVAADKNGTPHPPEDNNAIMDRYLDGTLFQNRGKNYVVTGYDPESGSYTAVQDLGGTQRGKAQYQFGESTIDSGSPVEPTPPAPPPPPRRAVWEGVTDQVTSGPSHEPQQPVNIPDDYMAKINAQRVTSPPTPAPEPSPEVLAPSDYLDWQKTGSEPMSPSSQEAFDPSLRNEPMPKQPTALAAETNRTQGQWFGPKEAATVSDEAPPPGVSEPWVGEKAHAATPQKPLPQTPPPKTPAEAAQRNTIWTAAGNILNRAGRVREMLGAANPKTAFHIIQQSGIRMIAEAFNQMIRSPFTGESAMGGFRAFGRLASPTENAAVMGGLRGALPEEAANIDRFMMNFPLGDQPLPGSQGFMYLNRQTHLLPKVAVAVARLEDTLAGRGMTLTDNLSSVSQPQLADAMSVADTVGFSRDLPWGLRQIANAPGVRLLAPYMRMRYNKILTNLVDYNPLSLVRFLNEEARARLVAGDPMEARNVVNAAFGTATIALGYLAAKEGQEDPASLQGRLSKYSGLAAFFLPLYGAGHLIYRAEDALKNNPAGAGSVISDELQTIGHSLFNVPGIDSTLIGDLYANVRKGQFVQGAEKAAADWLGTFTNITSSLAKIIDPVRRDTSGSIWDPTINHIPFASKTLPAYQSPTRAGDRPVQHPILEQAAVPVQEGSTDVEREMKRLGVFVSARPTKNAEEDRAYREELGPQIDSLNSYVNSPEYKQMPDKEKYVVLNGAVNKPAAKEKKVQEPISRAKQPLVNAP
jgi:hypothetical protein